jgi:calcium-dependent protein kinase
MNNVGTLSLHFISMFNAEWDAVSATARDFICSLLRKEPSERLTAPQALQHPWFATAAAASHNAATTAAGTANSSSSDSPQQSSTAGDQRPPTVNVTPTNTGELTLERINVRLRRFVGMNKLKKVALNVIAQQLTEAQIGHLRTMFEALDADGNGVISVQELRQVCIHA